MERIQDRLLPLLAQVLRRDGQDIAGIYLRNDVALREKEGLVQGKGWFPLPGETPPAETVTEIVENGVRYLNTAGVFPSIALKGTSISYVKYILVTVNGSDVTYEYKWVLE